MSQKVKFILTVIKSVSGVIGGALVLTENHPYITLLFLAIGAGANESLNFFKHD